MKHGPVVNSTEPARDEGIKSKHAGDSQVRGRVEEETQTLDFPIGKNSSEGKTHMMCTEGTEGVCVFFLTYYTFFFFILDWKPHTVHKKSKH